MTNSMYFIIFLGAFCSILFVRWAVIGCCKKKKKDFTYKDITDLWIEVIQNERATYTVRLKASKFLDDLRKEEGK